MINIFWPLGDLCTFLLPLLGVSAIPLFGHKDFLFSVGLSACLGVGCCPTRSYMSTVHGCLKWDNLGNGDQAFLRQARQRLPPELSFRTGQRQG